MMRVSRIFNEPLFPLSSYRRQCDGCRHWLVQRRLALRLAALWLPGPRPGSAGPDLLMSSMNIPALVPVQG